MRAWEEVIWKSGWRLSGWDVCELEERAPAAWWLEPEWAGELRT